MSPNTRLSVAVNGELRMPTKLIRLDDDLLVEVEVPANDAQPISGGMADKVASSMDKIGPVLRSVARSVAQEWAELAREVKVDHAELELGLSFEGEGNLFVTKSKASANLGIKIVLKPRE